MNFKTAAQHAHEQVCDKLRIPHDWSLVKFEKMPYEEYVGRLQDWHVLGFKVIFAEFDTMYQEVKGEFYCPPEYTLA